MSFRHLRQIAVLGVGQIVAFASSFYLLGVLADPMAASLGVPTAGLFAALSGAFLVSAVTGPAFGRWIDRRGGRGALMASNLSFAAGLAVLWQAQTMVAAVSGVLILGLGMGGGLYGAAFAVLVQVHGDQARRPITAVSLLGAFGGALGWPITLALTEALGWRGACLAWAGAHLLLCLPLHATLPSPRAEGRARPSTAPRSAIGWDGRMVRLAVLFAGAWTLSTAMSAHLPRLMVALGLEPGRAALTAGLMATAAIAVRLLDLTVLGRLPPLVLARAATMAHPLGALAAGALGSTGAPVLALAQGAGNGLLSVASGVLPLSLFGRENYAERHALMLGPARLMQAAGPLAYGLMLERSASLALASGALVGVVMFAATLGLGRQEF